MDGRSAFGVAALAAATLLLESTLTRLLAVAQFYHFAFLVVSLALLGFGASGTLLGLAPRLGRVPTQRLLAGAGIGFAASVGLAYAAINYLPFDSYSIAWERRQLLFFALYYLALTLPFLCAGLAIGAALTAHAGRSHLIYAANLLGAGIGAGLAPIMLGLAGVPGAVLTSALIGLTPAVRRSTRWVVGAVLVIGLAGLATLSAFNLNGRGLLGMTISPYKGLAHARRYPGSTSLFSRWNAISYVDVMGSAGTRSLPGLSYASPVAPPPQHGLSLDAEALQPITLVGPKTFEAADFLPEAVAFRLRPGARVLVLEPAGGLGVLQALAGGAEQVTAVVGNPLLLRAVAVTDPAANPYAYPHVRTVAEPARSFLARDQARYDVVFAPLTDPYRPVTSGAYSLAESYDLTVEAFAAALRRLAPDGWLVTTRWLQMPPSEGARLFTTLVEALADRGLARPGEALVAYRGIQTLTILARPSGWPPADLAEIRAFTAARRYDLVWAPDIRPDEVNRFNRLPTPAYFEAFRAVLEAPDRRGFYAAYPFAIAPATDDHPFFFHFFRWGQAPAVLAALGHSWQPFGGSGYFVLYALLALVLIFSGVLIIAPLLAFRCRASHEGRTGAVPASWRAGLAYFGLLGFAFLFVEVPLIQRWILLFGHPTYAFTAVVLTLLLFSGLGSVLARATWLPRRAALGTLALFVFGTALIGPGLIETGLSWPPLPRVIVAVASLVPIALLMGLPFPLGLIWLEREAPDLVPWAWAVNGCASVIASVVAAIVALSYGFTVVLLLGAGAYATAGALAARAWRVVR